MTGLAITNILLSPFTGSTCEVLAGPEQTRFVAHVSVLEKSEKLRAVTRGTWRDSSECKIKLEDWDAKTVGRFLQWLYTGDYESPYPVEVPQSELEETGILISESPAPAPSRQKVSYSMVPPKQMALGAFTDLDFQKAVPGLASSHANAFESWAAKSHGVLNFEATLLAHAKLYALANYMLLPTLQAQVFYRLKAVLLFISPSTNSLSLAFTKPGLFIANLPVIYNIVTLIEYVYANTARLESEEEPLRKLISTFVTLHYDQFRDDRGVVLAFMRQGGDFQGDIHDKMGKYQLDLKNEYKSLYKQLSEETIW